MILSLTPALAACRDAPPPPAERAALPAPAPVDARLRVAASMITIAHEGVHKYASRRPKPDRSEAEALELARALAAEARRDPARFPDLARERSEDPLAPDGGDLGTWPVGERPDIDGAVKALAIGAVSDPIPSEHGFRILRRDPPIADGRVAARHLVIAFAGATRAPAALTRTRADARARAEALAAQARQDPARFEAMIRAESDGWDRDRGGSLGTWRTNGGRYPAALDRAVLALPENAISSPVESQFGYHVLQRLAAPDAPSLLAAAHILIAYQGAEKAGPGVRRSKEEARAEAERIAAEAMRDPARFGQLAAAHSDDASAKRGGDLGSFRRGTLPAALEQVLDQLGMGEVGGPVPTPLGYHVLIRREAPTDKQYLP